ncbi:hypothetical protein [Psychrobacter sp. I-STPA10]|uniref:hypothetical protein n=1 Tax=Psychrobacter sp. I-STPA10 TaxID=2585769 RepID=UPI001E52B954|nr:hypothetical protein [Psychrobacter sp. I-STPA10]
MQNSRSQSRYPLVSAQLGVAMARAETLLLPRHCLSSSPRNTPSRAGYRYYRG